MTYVNHASRLCIKVFKLEAENARLMPMFKNFLMKQMFKSQLKNVPAEQQEKMFSALEKNPELFAAMAQKIEAKVKSGQDKMAAAIEVAREYQKELTEALK